MGLSAKNLTLLKPAKLLNLIGYIRNKTSAFQYYCLMLMLKKQYFQTSDFLLTDSVVSQNALFEA